ncbi:MAG: M23 family metallopeptidase [Dehalococcoidia bacterium]
MRRRTALAGLAFTGAGALGAWRQMETAAQAPRTYRVRVSGIAADLPVARAWLSAASAFQGGAVRVSTNPALDGIATLFGREHALQPGGAGLQGYVGVGTEDPAGATTVGVTLYTSDGPATVALPVTIRGTQWTVDYLTIPPPQPGDPDPLDPGAIRAEADLIFGIYAGRSARRWFDPWISPIDGDVPITAYFGEQRSINGGPVGGHHGGTDFGVGTGTPIHATNDGVVMLAERLIVRGNMVILDHGSGVFSGYAHLSRLDVTPGQAVVKGQVVGAAGATGLVTGAHLHWEVTAGGILVDGLRWLDGTQGF